MSDDMSNTKNDELNFDAGVGLRLATLEWFDETV